MTKNHLDAMMIVLDLPPQTQTILTQQANHAGLSIENYLIWHLEQLTTPKSRQLGGGEHFLLSDLDNFDEPLEDFKDYV